jgi:hypothetical protein
MALHPRFPSDGKYKTYLGYTVLSLKTVSNRLRLYVQDSNVDCMGSNICFISGPYKGAILKLGPTVNLLTIHILGWRWALDFIYE